MARKQCGNIFRKPTACEDLVSDPDDLLPQFDCAVLESMVGADGERYRYVPGLGLREMEVA